VTQSVALFNTGIGIRTFDGSTVQGCSATRNGVGIVGTEQTTVIDCTVTENQSRGIDLGRTSNVQRCNVSGNNGAAGVRVGTRSQIIDCIADDNGPDAGPASGIEGGERTIVKRCTATNNRLNGILVAGESVVTDNRASNNGAGGGSPGAGIRTTGSGSRIEGNQTRDNVGTGILAHPTADVIIRNTSGNNSVSNFNPSSGSQNLGPIQPPATATSPTANHVF
jgi:parallel beta-helix repeat protein